MASIGCVSGKMKEWPLLVRGLRKLGYVVAEDTHVMFWKQICQDIMDKVKQR